MPLSTGDDASVHAKLGVKCQQEAAGWPVAGCGAGGWGWIAAGSRWGWGWEWVGSGLARAPLAERQTGSVLVGSIGGRASTSPSYVGLSSLTSAVVRSDSCWDQRAERRDKLSRVVCPGLAALPAASWSVWPLNNCTPPYHVQ